MDWHGHGLGHARGGSAAGSQATGRRAERRRGRTALSWALAITLAFAATEVVGGILTGSLALLADAGHMVTDVMALALGLFAAWMAGRPATPRKTFGYYRAEILAALLNGAALALISGLIIWQAIGRLSRPATIDAGPMLAVAIAGLFANLLAGAILLRSGSDSLNVRGALLHVAGDALGSAGAIIAGAVMLVAGWTRADAVASLVISALVLLGAWRLLRESVDVLLEGTPSGLNLADVTAAMQDIPGVIRVHDVHAWTVTSGFVAMSAHAELDGTRGEHAVLDDLTRLLAERYHIVHVTVQPETAAHAADCCDAGCDPACGTERINLATPSRR